MTDSEAVGTLKEEYVRLQRNLGGLPSGLAELAGVTEDDLEWLAAKTVEPQERLRRCNPRPVTEASIRGVFEDGLHNWEK
jgi:alcohol dehydrogenase class IV